MEKLNRLSLRSSGILLHPTCLPSKYGIGDLGPNAYKWLDFMEQTKQTWWQMLPLGPTGYADSPYQCFSAFAGNIYLISPDELVNENVVENSQIENKDFPNHYVDFPSIIDFKINLLKKAWENFKIGKVDHLEYDFNAFCEKEKVWLEEYALFMAIKESYGGISWLDWGKELKMREEGAMERVKLQLSDEIMQQKFRQFLFFRQWNKLKAYANSKGIGIIGDIPIFISIDSADVWSRAELFQLDESRNPKFVAGVPPDYFSVTGQLWGNPHYDWEKMKQEDYKWWKLRLSKTLEIVDIVRIDHFRGFEAYWEIPAGNPTAQIGQWVKGPEYSLFDSLFDELGELPIIAEDLGVITPEVEALRDKYNFPGMKILQFAFAGAVESRFLPHTYDKNSIVYTGTHDNDTTLGFYLKAPDKEKDLIRRYVARDGSDICWDMIRLAWSSVSNLAIVPLQDILSLDSDARMNTPGTPSGNWQWRFTFDDINGYHISRLYEMTYIYDRIRKFEI